MNISYIKKENTKDNSIDEMHACINEWMNEVLKKYKERKYERK